MNSFFTLSVIDEITEVSTIDKRDSSQLERATVDAPYNSDFQSENYLGLPADAARSSFLSSDTSYGEVLPPGQLTLRGGDRPSFYAKSLPSIPGSVSGKSPSVRSEAASQTAGSRPNHSPRNSIARSGSQPNIEGTYSQPTVAFPEPQLASPTRSNVRSIHSVKQSSPKRSVKSSSSFSSSSSSSSLSSSLSSRTARPSPKVAPETIQEPATSKELPYRFSGQSSPPAYRSPSSGNKSLAAQAIVPVSPSARSRSISSSSSSSSSSSLSSTSSALTEKAANSNQLALKSARTDGSQRPLRTMDDVVDEVATSLALRAKMQAEAVVVAPGEQVKIGVCSTMSRCDDRRLMEVLAEKIHHAMALHASYLFALFPSINSSSNPVTLIICGAPQLLVTKAAILAGLRFKTRLAEVRDDEGTWTGALAPRPGSAGWADSGYDEELLWDILRKAIVPSNPAKPPPDSRGVEELLTEAREKLDRLNPREAFDEALGEGILVDIRPESQRIGHGTIPGAIFIERNDLEWCFDPRSTKTRLPIADRYDLRVIIYCQTGDQSSLAAVVLQKIGLWRTTDIIGGFTRWKEEGLPTNSVSDEQSEFRSSPATPRFRTSLI